MSKLSDTLLWLTAPGVLTMRRSATPLSRREGLGLLLTDSLTRLLLLGALVWMLAIGNWGIAALMAGLLVMLAVLRAFTTAWLLRRTGVGRR
jgi:hypothetical protein